MKSDIFKKVSFNNRKKQIIFDYRNGKRAVVHYGQLGIKTAIARAWIDSETRSRSVGLEFSNGEQDFVPYDQPLALIKDPQFLLQTHVETLTAKITLELTRKGISKRYLAEKLRTSDNQIQRLLNPKILNKNLEQLYEVAALLDLQFEFSLKRAA